MKIHKSPETLPIGCYDKILNSLNSDKPDYRYLYVLDNYFSLPKKQPKNGEQIFYDIICQFEKGSLSLELLELKAEYEIVKMMYIASKTIEKPKGDLKKKARLIILEDKLNLMLKENHKAKSETLIETCIKLEKITEIKINPYTRSCSEFFAIQKLAETIIAEQKKANKKWQKPGDY